MEAVVEMVTDTARVGIAMVTETMDITWRNDTMITDTMIIMATMNTAIMNVNAIAINTGAGIMVIMTIMAITVIMAVVTISVSIFTKLRMLFS